MLSQLHGQHFVESKLLIEHVRLLLKFLDADLSVKELLNIILFPALLLLPIATLVFGAQRSKPIKLALLTLLEVASSSWSSFVLRCDESRDRHTRINCSLPFFKLLRSCR